MQVSDQLEKKNNLIAFGTLLVILVSWFNLLDYQAYQYVKEIMVQAVAAFGSAKVISATVSMMKSLELGIGIASVQPGHLLKPLGDLSETYADFMRLSIGALIVQGILLKIVSSLAFKVFITIAGIWFATAAYFHKVNSTALAFKLFSFSIFLRFSVVVAIGLSFAVNNTLLQDEVDRRMQNVSQFTKQVESTNDNSNLSAEAKQALRNEIAKSKDQKVAAKQQLKTLNAKIENARSALRADQKALDERADELGTFASLWTDDEKYNRLSDAVAADQSKLSRLLVRKAELQKTYDQAVQTIKVNKATLAGKASGLLGSFKMSVLNVVSDIGSFKDKIGRLMESFDDIMSDIIYLMAAFIFRTLIMPLLFLYGLAKAFKAIWGIDIRTAIKKGKGEFNQEVRGNN